MTGSQIAGGAGYTPAQRDTLYRHIAVREGRAADSVDDRVHSHFSSTALSPA